MERISQVFIARAPGSGTMDSLGNANHMLLGMYKFPFEYDRERDHISGADHDRMMSQDYDAFRNELEKHTGSRGELSIGNFVANASGPKLLAFCGGMINAVNHYPEGKYSWTGCRVLGTVNRSNGQSVYTIEVFSNVSGVKVWSGIKNPAPNVEIARSSMSIHGRYTSYGHYVE